MLKITKICRTLYKIEEPLILFHPEEFNDMVEKLELLGYLVGLMEFRGSPRKVQELSLFFMTGVPLYPVPPSTRRILP